MISITIRLYSSLIDMLQAKGKEHHIVQQSEPIQVARINLVYAYFLRNQKPDFQWSKKVLNIKLSFRSFDWFSFSCYMKKSWSPTASGEGTDARRGKMGKGFVFFSTNPQMI